MGIIIGTQGRNIKRIERDTQTNIRSRNADESGEGSGFEVSGTAANVETARLNILGHVVSISVVYSLFCVYSYLHEWKVIFRP